MGNVAGGLVRAVQVAAIASIGATLALAGSAAANAVPPGTIGSFPAWNVTGSTGSFSGTAEFASPTLPSPTVTTNSVSLSVPTGESAYLGSNTSFGQQFGSSRSQPYLTVRPVTGSLATVPPSTTTPPPSLTTVAFPSQPAAGWGFAVGDIDADWAQITGFDSTGAALDPSALGEVSVGNYCDHATPKPSVCPTTTGTFDTPTWFAGPGTDTVAYGAGSIAYAPGTVIGNFNDTAGAYVWFQPAASVRKITILYGALNGSPSYQLWLAQPAPQTVISGTVAAPGLPPSAPAPSGTEIALDNADGTPVLSIDDTPVTVPVLPDGTFSIATEQRASYEIAVDPPPGFAAPPPVDVVATAATVVAPAIEIDAITPTAPAPTTEVATGVSGAELADTGSDPTDAAVFACLLFILGIAALGAARSRRGRNAETGRRRRPGRKLG